MKQLKELFRRVANDDFIRKVITLSGGTTLAQAISLASLPLLTRLYSPESMGILAVYTALVGTISVASCLRYNLAIPLAKDDGEAWALLNLSIGFSVLFSLIILSAALLAPGATSTAIGQPSLAPYLWMVSVGVLSSSIYNALQHWTARKQRFAALSKTRISQAAASSTAQISFGLVQGTPFGLLIGSILNMGFGTVRLWRDLKQLDAPSIQQLTTVKSLTQAARMNWRMPAYSVPEALLNTGGLQIPIVLIAAYADTSTAAFLFIAMKLMAMPTRLIGQSASFVFFGDGAKQAQLGDLKSFTKRSMKKLFFAGSIPIICAGALAPAAVPVILGENWHKAGLIAMYMTPWIAMQFLATSFSTLLHISGKLGAATILQAFGAILRIGFTLAAGIFKPEYIVEAFIASNTFFYAIYILAILLIAKTPQQKLNPRE